MLKIVKIAQNLLLIQIWCIFTIWFYYFFNYFKIYKQKRFVIDGKQYPLNATEYILSVDLTGNEYMYNHPEPN